MKAHVPSKSNNLPYTPDNFLFNHFKKPIYLSTNLLITKKSTCKHEIAHKTSLDFFETKVNFVISPC